MMNQKAHVAYKINCLFDFSRSSAVTCTVIMVVSWNWCQMESLLLQEVIYDIIGT